MILATHSLPIHPSGSQLSPVFVSCSLSLLLSASAVVLNISVTIIIWEVC